GGSVEMYVCGCGRSGGAVAGGGGAAALARSSRRKSGMCSTVGSRGSRVRDLLRGGEAASGSDPFAGSCSAAGGGSAADSCRCAASVALKSSARGPSRMLARLRATAEHLLCEIAISLGCVALGLVAKHRRALYGRLGVTDRL